MTAILQRGYVQSTSRNVANLYPMLGLAARLRVETAWSLGLV